MLNKKLSFLVLPFVATLSLQANDPLNDPFFQDPFGDDIFKEMMQMQHNMDKMFERMHSRIQQRTSNQIAPMGTYKIQQPSQFVDKNDHYEFVTTIPESKENQIDIHTENGLMAITAKIIQKQEQKTANSYSTSSSMRMYQQSIPLPNDADESTINMGYVDGMLVISVNKKKSANIVKAVQTQLSSTKKTEQKKVQIPSKSTDANSSKKRLRSLIIVL
ncbi:MAG: Hsp20/alpha crystallin family protein [Epsilonproteobacteria bacterium]|nr:Hsp20/alpha crystallin family protein [Campylobacterota bacterium]